MMGSIEVSENEEIVGQEQIKEEVKIMEAKGNDKEHITEVERFNQKIVLQDVET